VATDPNPSSPRSGSGDAVWGRRPLLFFEVAALLSALLGVPAFPEVVAAELPVWSLVLVLVLLLP
jgi:hypothetical protein